MNPITAWLAGDRSYTAGVKLYLEHGSHGLLKKLFAEPWSAFKEKKLLQVLQALEQPQAEIVPFGGHCCQSCADGHECESDHDHHDHEHTIQSLEAISTAAQQAQEALNTVGLAINKVADSITRTGWPMQMDETVTALYEKWLPLFSEKKNLQSRLHEVAKAGATDQPDKKKEAGEMAHRILDLRDQCRDIYTARDFYLQHGKLPEAKAPMELPTNPAHYHKAISNYERYIREYRAKLEKDANHPTAQAQIDKYTWGITELKKRLGINDAV